MLQLSAAGLVFQSTPPPTPSTTNPAGVVVTLGGGPYSTARIPGPHNDPADLYGIVLVIAAIGIALVATRWIFGRRGGRNPR